MSEYPVMMTSSDNQSSWHYWTMTQNGSNCTVYVDGIQTFGGIVAIPTSEQRGYTFDGGNYLTANLPLWDHQIFIEPAKQPNALKRVCIWCGQERLASECKSDHWNTIECISKRHKDEISKPKGGDYLPEDIEDEDWRKFIEGWRKPF